MSGRHALFAGLALFAVAGQLAGVPSRAARPSLAEPGSRGAQVFEKWCAACHARGPGHPGTQSLEFKYKGEIPAALEDRSDLAPETTAYFVRNGIALMPFFRKTEISDADLRELGAYLADEK